MGKVDCGPESLSIKLRSANVVLGERNGEGKDRLIVINGAEEVPPFCISDPLNAPRWIGILLELEEENRKEPLLRLSRTGIIPAKKIETILDHPFTQFKLANDGKGLGIADIRDLRNGSRLGLKFDLFQTKLVIALIRNPYRQTLVFGWTDENYSPF
jgi:hypothetical protein